MRIFGLELGQRDACDFDEIGLFSVSRGYVSGYQALFVYEPYAQSKWLYIALRMGDSHIKFRLDRAKFLEAFRALCIRALERSSWEVMGNDEASSRMRKLIHWYDDSWFITHIGVGKEGSIRVGSLPTLEGKYELSYDFGEIDNPQLKLIKVAK